MSNKHRNRQPSIHEVEVDEGPGDEEGIDALGSKAPAVGTIDPSIPSDAASETLEAPSEALGPSADPDLIPFSKAATLLGINISVLSLWAKTRLITPVKVPGLGGGYMISKAALVKLLEASQFPSNKTANLHIAP